MYLSYHSFGEKIVYPWSYTSHPLPDWRDLHQVGIAMSDAALQASNGFTRYRVGSPPEVIKS